MSGQAIICYDIYRLVKVLNNKFIKELIYDFPIKILLE